MKSQSVCHQGGKNLDINGRLLRGLLVISDKNRRVRLVKPRPGLSSLVFFAERTVINFGGQLHFPPNRQYDPNAIASTKA